MRIWSKKLTDAEYVESVRKTLQMNIWLRGLFILSAIGIAGLGFKAIETMIQLLLKNAPQAQQFNILAIFTTAAGLGLVAGLLLNQIAFQAIHSFARYRSEKLLIECWDRLLALENNELACSEPTDYLSSEVETA